MPINGGGHRRAATSVWAVVAVLLGVVVLPGAVSAGDGERIVSAGGAVTEIIYALGAGDRLVGVDQSSLYPDAVRKLPQIGYIRTLSAEGLLSLAPRILVTTTDAGPPAVLEQVGAAGVQIVKLSAAPTPEAAVERIREAAKCLGVEERGETLVRQLTEELEAAKQAVGKVSTRPKVLFLYAMGGGTMNVAGEGTAGAAVISLAGGANAVSGYEGYKPLTAEAAVAAAPDAILITTRGIAAAGGAEGLLRQPGLALTPAGKAGRIIVMEDLYLLGFGPRLGQAVSDLCNQLHPAPSAPTSGTAAR